MSALRAFAPRRQPTAPLKPTTRAPLLRPRKVRGGLKLGPGDIAPPTSPTAWAAQRWLRMLEQAGAGGALVEGLEYARLGQTKKLTMGPGLIEASVQGRGDRPYTTTMRVEPFTPEQWTRVIDAMADGAMYAAKLLAGELPATIEELFAPLGLALFPAQPTDVVASCTCAEFVTARDAAAAGGGAAVGWCKHLCCVGYLVGQRMSAEPYFFFGLRGLEGKELLERLRERRVVAGAGSSAVPVYTQHVPGVTDSAATPLDQVVDKFWDAGPGLELLDLPLTPPPVTHPLLRRLGPSPFAQASFPLVGLLASCYETIAKSAMEAVGREGEGAAPGEARADGDEVEVDEAEGEAD